MQPASAASRVPRSALGRPARLEHAEPKFMPDHVEIVDLEALGHAFDAEVELGRRQLGKHRAKTADGL